MNNNNYNFDSTYDSHNTDSKVMIIPIKKIEDTIPVTHNRLYNTHNI